MRINSLLRYAASAVALGGVAVLAWPLIAPPAQSQASFVQNGEAGFVISDIDFALTRDPASEIGACPNGMTLGGNRLREAVAAGQVPAPEPGTGAWYIISRGQGGGQRPAAAQAGQTAAPAQAPAQQQAAAAPRPQGGANRDIGPNPCSNPEQYAPDPYWRSMEQTNVPAYGIDLDGQVSTANGRAAPGTCAHNDFRGLNGERGIDNQFYRAVGCSYSYQPGGQSRGFATEMLTGAWGIVIRMRGVDDIRNDNDVTVEIAANADPIQLSPNREPIPNATYAMWQDPRFRATTHGRIRNGVLTTDPVDFRFWKITNSFWLERPLLQSRIQATISPDGTIEGYFAGYTPVEDIYNFQYAYRRAYTGPDGTPNPRAVGSGLGGNVTVGHSCNGAFYALYAAADGNPDASGRCTSISTQYHIKAIPAFIVDAATSSANADLRPTGLGSGY